MSAPTDADDFCLVAESWHEYRVVYDYADPYGGAPPDRYVVPATDRLAAEDRVAFLALSGVVATIEIRTVSATSWNRMAGQ